MRRQGRTAGQRGWDEAHERWLSGVDSAEAGRELPGSLPLALRALDALDRDDEAATRALIVEARAAGADAVLAALQIALRGASEGSRSERAELPSPVLDGLADGIEKWLAGGSPRGRRAQLRGARARPVAESARTLLAKKGSRTLKLPADIDRWPRANALLLALWGARLGGSAAAAEIIGRSPVAAALDLVRYPGLASASAKAPSKSLSAWLDGGSWSPRVKRALLEVSDAPQAEGEARLAQAIDRLRCEIEAGRAAPALEALGSVAKLACRLDHHDLEEDIFAMTAGLRWASSGKTSPYVLESLWRAASERGEEQPAMVVLAKDLVEDFPEEGDPHVLQEALITLLRSAPDSGLRMRGVTFAPPLLSTATVRRLLAERHDVSSAEVAWLVGLHGAMTRDAATALEQGTALLEEGVRPDRACDLLIAGWGPASARGASRALVTAARRSVDALAVVESVDLESAHRLARALGLLRRGLGKHRSVVRAVILASIPADLSPQDPDVGHALALHARLGGLAAARLILRGVGRALRTLPPAAADTLALGILARVRQWEPTPLAGDLARVAQPLEAWLDQAGEERKLAAGEALCERPAAANVYAASWLEQHGLLLDQPELGRFSALLHRLAHGGRKTTEGLRLELLTRFIDEDLQLY